MPFSLPFSLPCSLDFGLTFGGGCVTAGVELLERVEKAFSFARALRNMVLTVDVAKGECQESWGWREKNGDRERVALLTAAAQVSREKSM